MDKQNLRNRRSLLRLAFPFTTPAMMCFAFLPFAPKAFGVVPAPDGGYPGDNTAEGQDALFSRTTGIWNTATGFEALKTRPLAMATQQQACGRYPLILLATGIPPSVLRHC